MHKTAVFRPQLRQWFSRPPGSLLETGETEQLSNILPDLFGYHLLQVGRLSAAELVASSRIAHRIVLEMDRDVSASDVGVYADACALPIASDSVDVLLFPHTLEFAADPYQVLREADRVLIPEGHLVVLGFNPWSLFGVWRLFLARRNRVPWCGRFLSVPRLRDWLAVLGFDTVRVQMHFFRPPLKRQRVMRRLRVMENIGGRFWPALAGGYVVVARKRVATLTPIKPRWRPRRRLVAPDLVEPTTRGSANNAAEC